MKTEISLLQIVSHPRIFPLLIWQFLNNWSPWIGIIMIYFNNFLELSFTQIMLLQSLFMFSSAFFEIPTGIIGDKFGRKLSVIASVLFFSIGFSIYLFKLPIIFYFLGEIIMGIGKAFRSGSDEALQYDTFRELNLEKSYSRFISFQRSVILSSFLISGVFGTLALKLGLSLRFLLLSTPIFYFASLPILIFLIKEPLVRTKESFIPNYRNYIKTAIHTH